MTTTVIKTIRASGGDYSLLSTWEAANQGDLVTADEVRVAECYNDWPSGLNDAVNIDGSATDATRYMAITVAAGHRHTGKPDTGFRIVRSAAYTAVVLFNDPYCRASWLDVRNTGYEGSTAIRQNGSNGSNSRVSRCIGRTTGTVAYVSCFAGLAYTYQCLALGGVQGFQGTGTYGTFEMVGCVASGSTTGFVLDSPGTAKRVANCVAYNCTTNYSGTFDAALSGNNASTSGTMPGSSNVSGVTSSDFVDASGHDYHLAGGSALIGMGANLYTLITEDVDGDAWPSSGAWDIGFDYYVASGHTISVGQVTETDSAQAISRRKVKAFGQAAETDVAQPITASGAKTIAVGRVTETDLAQAVASRKLKAFGQVAESDTAQAFSKQKVVRLWQVTETDTAQAITASGPKRINVGQIVETDVAQAFTRFRRKLFGQVAETDTAFAISRRKIRTVRQVGETDSALGMTSIGGIPSDGWADEVAIGGTGWAAASGASGSWTEAGAESGTWVEESAL